MKNNTLLKIYLCAAAISVLMFGLTFACSWLWLENMSQVYAATLPFIFIAVLSLAAFGMTSENKTRRAVKKNIQTKVIQIEKFTKTNSIIYSGLRKIS